MCCHFCGWHWGYFHFHKEYRKWSPCTCPHVEYRFLIWNLAQKTVEFLYIINPAKLLSKKSNNWNFFCQSTSYKITFSFAFLQLPTKPHCCICFHFDWLFLVGELFIFDHFSHFSFYHCLSLGKKGFSLQPQHVTFYFLPNGLG